MTNLHLDQRTWWVDPITRAVHLVLVEAIWGDSGEARVSYIGRSVAPGRRKITIEARVSDCFPTQSAAQLAAAS